MIVISSYSNFLAAPMQGPSAVCAKPPELLVRPQQGHPVFMYEKKKSDERREEKREEKRREGSWALALNLTKYSSASRTRST